MRREAANGVGETDRWTRVQLGRPGLAQQLPRDVGDPGKTRGSDRMPSAEDPSGRVH
jgi:hypothetical protein